jgi:RNase adaptor protein for sRNA GlmZ degradation
MVNDAREEQPMNAVEVISFGYGHGAAPEAHAVYDVRHHFKDPHVNPALRELDGTDLAVIDAVMATPGIRRLIDAITITAGAFLAGPRKGKVVIAVGCVGGRHRSVAVAGEVAARLSRAGFSVTLCDRDRHRPVIARPARDAQ